MSVAYASLARKTALCFPTQRHRCGDPAVRGMACSWRHCGDGQRSTSPDSGFTVGDGWRVACWYLGNVGNGIVGVAFAPQAELIKAQGPYCSISAFDRGTPIPTY
jgi:hypothetical protein